MSHLSSIHITYSPATIGFFEIVSAFLENEWNLNDHGAISYLPLGTNDPDDWQRGTLTEQGQILEIIQEKEKRGEFISLVIRWKNSGIGCSVLFQEKGRLTFSLDVNRKLLSDKHRFTDVSWYIDQIFPLLMSLGITIVSADWHESI